MDKYQKKQFKIGLVYLFILIIIVGGIYLIAKPKPPNCFDGIQNQGEAGVDCGVPCPLCPWQLRKNLEVISAEAIKTKDNYVDLAAKVKNSNQNFGVKSFSYVFDLYDSGDNLIVSKEGSSYILPQETKYVIEQKVLVNSDISKIELKIPNVDWRELIDYQKPILLIRNPEFKQTDDSRQVTGTLENKSSYDFNRIDIYAVLSDEDFNILGAGKTYIETVLSKENRYFEISWLFPVKGQVKKVETMATTNIFLDENFMRSYRGERERFQEY